MAQADIDPDAAGTVAKVQSPDLQTAPRYLTAPCDDAPGKIGSETVSLSFSRDSSPRGIWRL